MQGTDIQIARESCLDPITTIGQRLGIPEAALLPYGHDKAKIDYAFIAAQQDKTPGKLILVTAVSPTPAGEGKTTTTIGLGDALNRIGKNGHLPTRAESWPLLRHEGRRRWRWLRPGRADGRY